MTSNNVKTEVMKKIHFFLRYRLMTPSNTSTYFESQCLLSGGKVSIITTRGEQGKSRGDNSHHIDFLKFPKVCLKTLNFITPKRTNKTNTQICLGTR